MCAVCSVLLIIFMKALFFYRRHVPRRDFDSARLPDVCLCTYVCSWYARAFISHTLAVPCKRTNTRTRRQTEHHTAHNAHTRLTSGNLELFAKSTIRVRFCVVPVRWFTSCRQLTSRTAFFRNLLLGDYAAQQTVLCKRHYYYKYVIAIYRRAIFENVEW